MPALTPSSSASSIPAGTWSVDPDASEVAFSIKHLGVATVHGRFEDFDGRIVVGRDGAWREAAGSVRIASVETADPRRSDVIRSPDFFDAERFPAMTFTSTATRRLADDRYELHGDLTIRDVTRPVTLVAHVDSADGDGCARIRVEGKVDRTRWGMPFTDTAGSALLSKDVKIRLELTAALS